MTIVGQTGSSFYNEPTACIFSAENDAGSRFHRHVGTYLPNYTVSYLRARVFTTDLRVFLSYTNQMHIVRDM